MAGHTTNDGTGFTGSPTSITNDTQLYSALTSSRYTGLVSRNTPSLVIKTVSLKISQSKDTFSKARDLYPVSNFSSYYDMAETLVGNTEFTCLDWFIVNKTASYGVPAFNYRYVTVRTAKDDCLHPSSLDGTLPVNREPFIIDNRADCT